MQDSTLESDLEANTDIGPQRSNDEVSMSDLETIGDLSTLANDMSVAAPPVAWAPVSESERRDNNNEAYKTPRKPSKKVVVQDDDDTSTGETAPETPPDTIKVKQPKSSTTKNSYGDESGTVHSDYSYDDHRIKRIFCMATLLGFILLASIGALAIALVRIRQTDSDSDGGSDRNKSSPQNGLPSGTPAPIDLGDYYFPPTGNPVSGPTTVAGTVAPTPAPVFRATPAPSAAPVATTVADPVVVEQRNNLLAILEAVSPESIIDSLDDDNSPQAKATQWLAADPDFASYSPERLVQRWVLTVVFESFNGGNVGGRQLQGASSSSALPGWKTYTEECQWFSTRPDDFCNRNGLVRSIDIRDAFMSGTLPKELQLLSNSLVSINLPGNLLQGTLPSELARLTRLDRLQLTGNDIGGSIPTDLFSVTTLNLIGLGRNNLVGNIPEEIGNLIQMTTFGIESNSIEGTIPRSIQSCEALRFVSLNNNLLTGTIPRQLGGLTGLELLLLHNNDLQGAVPDTVCQLTTDFLLEEFYTDCEVDCSCCEECNGVPTTPSPTATSSPTSAPVPTTPIVTDGPTEEPSALPTSVPTSPTTPRPTPCEDFIQVEGCIDEITQFITISFANCEPEEDDWIAVYPADRDPQDLGDPVMWSWTCGDQNCRGESSGGTIVFQEDFFEFDTGFQWPLSRREDWKIHILRRNRGGPYSSFASADLNVRRSCN